MEARTVSTFDQLSELIVLDKFKSTLSNSLQFLLVDHEMSEKLTMEKAAKMVDEYEIQHGVRENFRLRGNANFKPYNSYNRGQQWQKRGEESFSSNFAAENKTPQNEQNREPTNMHRRPFQTQNRNNIRCTTCMAFGHYSQNCTQKKAANNSVNKVRTVYVANGRGVRGRRRGRYRYFNANRVTVQADTAEHSEDSQISTCETKRVAVSPVSSVDGNPVDRSLGQFMKPDVLSVSVSVPAEETISVIFGEGEGAGPVLCISDSGSQVSVVHTRMVPASATESSSCLFLQGAFGEKVTSRLCNVQARVACDTAVPTTITVAVTDQLQGSHALLTPSDFQLVTSLQFIKPTTEFISDTPYLFSDPSLSESENQCRISEIHAVSVPDKNNVKLTEEECRENLHSDVINDGTTPSEFLKLQKEDPTLAGCWAQVGVEGSAFFTDKEFLFRKASVGNVAVTQLCVPQCKRENLIKFAHSSMYALHFAKRKTLLRLQSYFYFPSMQSHVDRFISRCGPCARHLAKSKFDRTPISAVPLASESFAEVQCDIVGPINPTSARGHKYMLTIICAATKFAEAVALKTLTAKEVIDSMVKVFLAHGRIPYKIGLDQGSNFTSNLATAVFERLGITPHYSCPSHGAGHGNIERLNRSLQDRLHHILNSKFARDWDQKLPFVCFSYNELPHSTTGCSPVALTFGYAPRGALSVLRDTWSARERTPLSLDKSATEYLQGLKADLNMMHDIAVNHAKTQQERYVNYYNKDTRTKSFKEDDTVLILCPDSTNKLKSRWIPGTVVKVLDGNAYSVHTPDGATRVVHADILRPCVANVASVGIMFDEDVDFGQVLTDPTLEPLSDFEHQLSQLQLSHLNDAQKHQLLTLLRKHKAVFSDKPGKCTVIEAALPLKPDFEYKRPNQYRLPDKVKPIIQEQIDELLAEGRIQPANTKYAHPIVAVAKKGTLQLRMTCDFRQLNVGLVPHPYEMPRCDVLVREVAPAKILSTLDSSQAFWSIPLRESDRHKAGFVFEGRTYTFNYLAYGLATASQIFQEAIDIALMPVRKHSTAYVDDVTTATRENNFDLHIAQLDQTLTALHTAGFNLKMRKCKWAMPQIPFIGFLVGQGKISPLHDKLEAIRDIPVPTTKKAVRAFLGVCGWYRCFSARFSKISVPLVELTRNSAPARVVLSVEQLNAFQQLKDELCKATELYTSDPNAEFTLYVDSSKHSCSGALSQYDSEGILRPVAFYSHKFDATQFNYSMIEKEAYALVHALKVFEHFIFGCSLVVAYTDHQPLIYLQSKMPPSPKMLRWLASIQHHRLEFKRVTSEDNVVADFLSRYVY